MGCINWSCWSNDNEDEEDDADSPCPLRSIMSADTPVFFESSLAGVLKFLLLPSNPWRNTITFPSCCWDDGDDEEDPTWTLPSMIHSWCSINGVLALLLVALVEENEFTKRAAAGLERLLWSCTAAVHDPPALAAPLPVLSNGCCSIPDCDCDKKRKLVLDSTGTGKEIRRSMIVEIEVKQY